MSAGQDQAIEGARERARIAGEAARGGAVQDSKPAAFRPGKVVSVSGSVYTVEVIGANGTAVDTIPGVTAWGEGTFPPGDRVFLAWIGDRPIPYIVGSGGGGGGEGQIVIAGYWRFFG